MDAVAEVHILDVWISSASFLEFGLVLFSEPVEVADDETSVGAVVYEEAGRTYPALQII